MMPGARIIGMGMTLVVAALHAWSARHAANADGISYLDLGDAFARGDLANAVNAHWSPAYALLQVQRVAEARGIPETQVRALVETFIQGRDLGYLGGPTVNVLQLNIALAKLG